MKTHSRYRAARGWLLFWTLFVGLGAVAGALCMLIDPSGRSMGMDAMLPYFQKLPFAQYVFQDFTFSGWALLIVNGLTNLTAAALLLLDRRSGSALGCAFGVTLMLWICIQFYMFPVNFMDVTFFLVGLAQAITGFAAWAFYGQEEFAAHIRRYDGIGANDKRLVVYFSRLGSTRQAALEEAERTGAQVFELRTTERTEGTTGFWWCGRFGMHRWEMPLERMPDHLERYEHVTICSPVWVFGLSAPVRAFCRQAAGQIREADYVLTHHQRGDYARVADEMDAMLGLRRTGLTSICFRRGHRLSLQRRGNVGERLF